MIEVAELNRLLVAGQKRAEELTFRLAKVLEPILIAAGREAARNFEARATNHLTAAAPGLSSLSTMIAVVPRPDEAAEIAEPDGLEASTLHVTLCYLGEVEGDLTPLLDVLAPVAATTAPLEGVVGGTGWFAPDPETGLAPEILLPDVPGLVELRVAVSQALYKAGIDYARNHGFCAHVTVDYGSPEEEASEVELPEPFGAPLHFDSLLIVRGDVVEAELPLVGPPPVTAAAGWTSPAPDELIDTAKLTAALRGKTDPVRLAAIEAMMGQTLERVGLDWDPQNPHARAILEQSASQVTNIVETTRDNVNRVIRASYEEGYSIPDTAKAIRRGMRDAAGARAELIARTELSGAVNGGSLAAARIVEGAGGSKLYKQWLTAPGAPHPRHYLYEGLNGQTRPLNGLFDVGGSELDHPGDPAGPPHEVCNCRCTLVYTHDAGQPDNVLIVPGLGEVPLNPPKARGRVAEIQQATTDYEHLSNEEMHSVMTSEARQPLLNIAGNAGPALLAKEAAIRDIGTKIVAEIDERLKNDPNAPPDKKKLLSLHKRRRTGYQKASQALFEAKSNLHDDVLARLFPGRTLGSLNDEEYDAFRAALNAAPELEKLAQREQRALELYREAEQNLTGIDGRIAAARRDHLADVLAEVRPMGGTLEPGSEAAPDVARLVQRAVDNMPAAWVQASNDFRRPLHIDWASGQYAGRGFYQHHLGTHWEGRALIDGESSGLFLTARNGIIGSDPAGLANAVHEFAHRLEYVVPEIRFLEWTFLQRRTVLSPNPADRVEAKLVELRPWSSYGPHEFTVPDKFTDPYIGKTYGSSPGSSGEVFSMGLEGVLNGENDVWDGDPDLRDFILGLLAAL